MIGFENINSRIIACSVNQQSQAAVNTVKNEPVRTETENTSQKKELENKKLHAKAMKGATILAGIVVAGIAITKGRKPLMNLLKRTSKHIEHNNVSVPEPSFTSRPVYPESFDIDKVNKELMLNERLKDIIRERYPKITNIAKDSVERQKERLSKLLRPDDNKLQFKDKRMFVSHEAEMVASYQDEYAFNTPLRLGKISPEKSIEIRTLDAMMKDAAPLEDKAVVYRGIVTQHEGKVLDFSRELYAGNIVEDKAFLSTSRNAAETIAEFGEQSGYVIRINLPEGTKGIDCRRFTMRELDTGANAEFILPRNSKLRINSVDDNYKIIDADYLLQN